jgi:hypothetical protein
MVPVTLSRKLLMKHLATQEAAIAELWATLKASPAPSEEVREALEDRIFTRELTRTALFETIRWRTFYVF